MEYAVGDDPGALLTSRRMTGVGRTVELLYATVTPRA